MSDEEAMRILNEDSEWFASQEIAGQHRPDWHSGWTKTPKLQLDGRFSLEELQALIHFHPSNHV